MPKAPCILTAARNIAHILLHNPTQQWQATSNSSVLLTEDGDIQEETTYEIHSLLLREDTETHQYSIQCATSDPQRPMLYITPENHPDFYFEIPYGTPASLNATHPLLQLFVSTAHGQIQHLCATTHETNTSPFLQRYQEVITCSLEVTQRLLQLHIPDLPPSVINNWAYPLTIYYELYWPVPNQPQSLEICYSFSSKNNPPVLPHNGTPRLRHAITNPDYTNPPINGLYYFRNQLLLATILPLIAPVATLYTKITGKAPACYPLELHPAHALLPPSCLFLRYKSANFPPIPLHESALTYETTLVKLLPPVLQEQPTLNHKHSYIDVLQRFQSHLDEQHLQLFTC